MQYTKTLYDTYRQFSGQIVIGFLTPTQIISENYMTESKVRKSHQRCSARDKLLSDKIAFLAVSPFGLVLFAHINRIVRLDNDLALTL